MAVVISQPVGKVNASAQRDPGLLGPVVCVGHKRVSKVTQFTYVGAVALLRINHAHPITCANSKRHAHEGSAAGLPFGHFRTSHGYATAHG